MKKIPLAGSGAEIAEQIGLNIIKPIISDMHQRGDHCCIGSLVDGLLTHTAAAYAGAMGTQALIDRLNELVEQTKEIHADEI